MRISDWSSDVCSSDLVDLATPAEKMPQRNLGLEGVLVQLRDVQEQLDRLVGLFVEQVVQAAEIGRRQPADLGVAVALAAAPADDPAAERGHGQQQEEPRSEEHTSEPPSLMRIS